jgi:hypothetical protein
MMDVKRFDWDKYVRSASYYAVLKIPAQPRLPVQ